MYIQFNLHGYKLIYLKTQGVITKSFDFPIPCLHTTCHVNSIRPEMKTIYDSRGIRATLTKRDATSSRNTVINRYIHTKNGRVEHVLRLILCLVRGQNNDSSLCFVLEHKGCLERNISQDLGLPSSLKKNNTYALSSWRLDLLGGKPEALLLRQYYLQG